MKINVNIAEISKSKSLNLHKRDKSSVFGESRRYQKKEDNGLINQKKNFAKRQAMQLIGDAWKKDKKTSEKIADMEQIKAQKNLELNEMGSQLKDIDTKKRSLQKEYGIDSNSQEQMDLNILQKFQNYSMGYKREVFSSEEIERLGELQNIPQTEYQKQVLEYNKIAESIKFEIMLRQNEIMGSTQSVTDAKLEQLKSQNMINARNAAKSIMEATSEEVLGMLVQDGLNKIEEDNKEEEKKADDTVQKEDKQNQLDNTMDKTMSMVEETHKKIDKIRQKNSMTSEDLKGILIDFNF